MAWLFGFTFAFLPIREETPDRAIVFYNSGSGLFLLNECIGHTLSDDEIFEIPDENEWRFSADRLWETAKLTSGTTKTTWGEFQSIRRGRAYRHIDCDWSEPPKGPLIWHMFDVAFWPNNPALIYRMLGIQRSAWDAQGRYRPRR